MGETQGRHELVMGIVFAIKDRQRWQLMNRELFPFVFTSPGCLCRQRIAWTVNQLPLWVAKAHPCHCNIRLGLGEEMICFGRYFLMPSLIFQLQVGYFKVHNNKMFKSQKSTFFMAAYKGTLLSDERIILLFFYTYKQS